MITLACAAQSLRNTILAALGCAGTLACAPGEEVKMQAAGTDTTVAPTTTTTGGESTTSTGTSTSTNPGTGTSSVTPTSGSGSESSTGPAPLCPLTDCLDPVEIFQAGSDPPAPSGLVRCANGLIHRAQAVTCVAPTAAVECTSPADPFPCTSDADCTDRPFGTCASDCGGCHCVYGCQTDADCDTDQVCLCAAEGVSDATRCVPAGCITDAECDGTACGASMGIFLPLQVNHFACHNDDDACCDDMDCAGADCRHDSSEPNVWACSGNSFCGRPLRVDGHSRQAEVVPRDDWTGVVAGLSLPDPARRLALARHWTRMARAEHASVGSFARFILQLLAIGAPAVLVAQAQQAIADEVEHARVCFALAAAYGAVPVGPGPLPAALQAPSGEFAQVVKDVIEEACVGETLSALELLEAAAHTEDPVLRGLLSQIAADEARHAALGWSVVQWALASNPALRRLASEWFAAAITAAQPGTRAGDASLRPFGVVDPDLRAQVVHIGIEAVLRPCATALLAA